MRASSLGRFARPTPREFSRPRMLEARSAGPGEARVQPPTFVRARRSGRARTRDGLPYPTYLRGNTAGPITRIRTRVAPGSYRT